MYRPVRTFALWVGTFHVVYLQIRVSINRLTSFMADDEINDELSNNDGSSDNTITVENGSFKWDPQGDAVISKQVLYKMN